MMSDFSVARSRQPLHGKYVATGCRRQCRRLHSPRNCVNCADSSDKLPQTTETMTYTYGVLCVRVCGQAWVRLKSATDSREMPPKLANVCPELPFVFDLSVCLCESECCLALSHTSQIYMAKKWHLEVDTQSACCIIATHTHSKYNCTRGGVGGEDREGVGSATHPHT